MPELHHLRTLQDFAEFGLPDQKALQQRMIAILEVGEHPQFLDGPCREILCFVDDQQATLSLAGHADQERFEGHQYVRLGDIPGAYSECRSHQTQGVVGIELGAHQLRGDELVLIETFEHAAHDRCLAGSDFTGDDDEAFVLMHAVFEISGGTPMLLAGEIERGIGIELEGLAGQAIE